MDVLSDVLQNVRLTGSVMFCSDFRAPWGIAAPSTQDYASLLVPGAHHLAIFHIIVEGRCYAGRAGGEPIEIATGDAVLLPQGDAHLLADRPDRPLTPMTDILPMPPWSKPPFLIHGGDGPLTRVLCCFLHCADARLSPFLATLPPALRIDGGERVASSLLAVQRLLIEEARSERPGHSCVLARLTETFFIEALRQHIGNDAHHSRALAALRDPIVGRALALMHDEPVRRWTVETLAREAAVSRSVLASRFTTLLGCPPMQYLTRWRLLVAARRLRDGREDIGAVAADAGYESESAFNKAFKRYFGTPPATWVGRRAVRLDEV